MCNISQSSRFGRNGKGNAPVNSGLNGREPDQELERIYYGVQTDSSKNLQTDNSPGGKVCQNGSSEGSDIDLTTFGDLDNSVRAVLESCPIIRYLCQKARKTQYLGHFERLTILYVFGHVGEGGNAFVHQIMSCTMNYSYQTTQKSIRRRPDKPITCVKLREQYKQISAELGCSCAFKRTKNCYPSPVLHALKFAEEDNEITIPVSRTLTESKAELMKNEINVANRVQTIAERMLELRRQMRGLEKNIKSVKRAGRNL